MPLTRLVLAACGALLPLSTSAQGTCASRPAECQVNVQVFDFGRHQMSLVSPPVNGHNSVTVTCTKSPLVNNDVEIRYDVLALPNEQDRSMRDNAFQPLTYGLFTDATRTRYWGDGSQGTSTIRDVVQIDRKNNAVARIHQVYGRVDGGQTAHPGVWLGLVLVRLDYEPRCR